MKINAKQRIMTALENGPLSSFELWEQTQLWSGRMYPVLILLEQSDRITSAWNEAEWPNQWIYSLTEKGKAENRAFAIECMRKLPGGSTAVGSCMYKEKGATPPHSAYLAFKQPDGTLTYNGQPWTPAENLELDGEVIF